VSACHARSGSPAVRGRQLFEPNGNATWGTIAWEKGRRWIGADVVEGGAATVVGITSAS
jgi:hypothetical protein